MSYRVPGVSSIKLVTGTGSTVHISEDMEPKVLENFYFVESFFQKVKLYLSLYQTFGFLYQYISTVMS